jgi:hypothetical protein
MLTAGWCADSAKAAQQQRQQQQQQQQMSSLHVLLEQTHGTHSLKGSLLSCKRKDIVDTCPLCNPHQQLCVLSAACLPASVYLLPSVSHIPPLSCSLPQGHLRKHHSKPRPHNMCAMPIRLFLPWWGPCRGPNIPWGPHSMRQRPHNPQHRRTVPVRLCCSQGLCNDSTRSGRAL